MIAKKSQYTKRAKPQFTRCEGYVRHGGAFTLGPVTWAQCEDQAKFQITVTQEKTESFPICEKCWKEAIENKMKIKAVVPLT